MSMCKCARMRMIKKTHVRLCNCAFVANMDIRGGWFALLQLCKGLSQSNKNLKVMARLLVGPTDGGLLYQRKYSVFTFTKYSTK